MPSCLSIVNGPMITVDARFMEAVGLLERSLRAGRVDRFTLCILRDRDILRLTRAAARAQTVCEIILTSYRGIARKLTVCKLLRGQIESFVAEQVAGQLRGIGSTGPRCSRLPRLAAGPPHLIWSSRSGSATYGRRKYRF